MNSKKILLILAVVAVLPMASCSGLKNGACSTGCTTGNANVTISLYDTPPSGLNILSFTLPIAGISLTPSSGTGVENVATTVTSVEATHLQTDSIVIADNVQVPAGSYTTINVTLGPTTATTNVFINTTGSAITYTLSGSSFTCPVQGVCYLPAGAVYTISIPLTLTLTENQNQWIGLDLNLGNAITTAKGLSVDFTQTGVLKATTTVRTGIPTGAADTIEDFVGVVTAYSSGSSITVQSGVSGQKITAVLNSSTAYDTPPSGSSYTSCSSTAQACIAVGSTVSLDALLSASGTLTATEVDALDAKAVDEVEGVIYPTSNTSVFGLILADKVSASGNSVLGAATTSYGTPFFVTVSGANIFAIDTKTLTSSAGLLSGFARTSDLLAGQQVRMQVSNVTSTASGITASAKSMLLRFSRMSGSPASIGNPSFNFTPPTYVTTLNTGLTPSPQATTYTGTVYDGITGVGDPNFVVGSPAAIRALFLNNTNPTFAVAKIRVP